MEYSVRLEPNQDACLYKQCEAIRSEQCEKDTFHEPTNIQTSSEQTITFAKHKYGLVEVFKIEMRSLVQNL